MEPLCSPGPAPKGKILKLKQGYNPNSSSIGTMIFALPAAMLSTAIAFGTVSGLICSAFLKKEEAVNPKQTDNPETDTPEEE
ncbi:MAG: hypothetical protein MUC65_05025 [Pontiellaceae bacterium]|jgi:hypothetical protein|nr:hypothetical protein [Pontiellaceae bacterium]